MELESKLNLNFSDLNRTRALRIDNNFHQFDKNELKKWISCINTCNLNEFLLEIRNGKDVAKTDYFPIETKYFYITVNNIKSHNFDFTETIFLNENKGDEIEKYKLNDGDLIVTRSGTVGVCKYFQLKDKVYIPSGYLMVLKIDKNKFNGKFLQYLLNTNFYNEYLWSISAGKTQKNLSQELLSNIILPDVPIELQNEIIEDLEKNEVTKIEECESKLMSLQEIIEEIFVKYNLKDAFFHSSFEVLNTNFSNLNNQTVLRFGAQYRAFWDKDKGFLFKGTNKDIKVVKFADLMKLADSKRFMKGSLDKDYILIELEDIENYSGSIFNENKIVNEIDSAKVCFGDCDIITSKMRPYLGYTILNNPEKEYIGTTELLLFKVKEKKVRSKYLKYILLSQEYLKKSSLLMYGKEHPRIHPLDLLSIKIPFPDLEVQDQIIEEIKEMEKENNKLKKDISKLLKDIENKILCSVIKKN